jgi:hypothetical protein
MKQFTQTFDEFLNEAKKRKKILTHRRSKEERSEKLKATINKKIQKYIKNGCKGHLNLHKMPITELPDNLKYVGGDLILSQTKITSLPVNLKVKGELELKSSLIKHLPKGLKVGGGIDLIGSKIVSLPDGLKVNDYLYVAMTNDILSLPNKLEVSGTLHVRYSSIQEIPSDVKAKLLLIGDTPFADKYSENEIIKMLPNVKTINFNK